MKDHVIWQDVMFMDSDEIEETIKYLKEDGIIDEEVDDDAAYEEFCDLIADDFEAVRYQFGLITVPNEFVAIGNVGRWDGRFAGYQTFDYGDSLDRVFDVAVDGEIKIYVEDDDLKIEEVHHDGRNYFTFRERAVEDDDEWEAFLDRLYYGTATEEDIAACTNSLMPEVSKYF